MKVMPPRKSNVTLPRYQVFIGETGRLLWIAWDHEGATPVEKLYEVVGVFDNTWKLRFICIL